MKSKAIGYVRQSTTKQASLAWQEDIIRSEADKRSHRLERIFYDKASGGNSERMGFSLMKECIATKAVDFLYVWRLDRISRNVSDLLDLYDFCIQYNVTIISISDPITATGDSMARFQISVVGSVAQLQRELISENQRIGLRKKHEMGFHLSARVPFGYRYYTKDKIMILDDEAETVRTVYDLYINGNGYKKICSRLSSKGVLSRGNPFKVHNVRNILTNPFYSGYIENEFGRVQGSHPPIVTSEMQDAVQQIQKSRRVVKKDFRRNLLQKKIKCPYCGNNLSIHIVSPNQKSRRYKKLYYYGCSSNSSNGKVGCEGIHLRAEKTELQVVTAVAAFLNDKERLERIQSKLQQKFAEKKEKHAKKLGSIESRKQTALEAFERGTFSAKQLADELKRLNQYKSEDEAVQPKDEVPDTVHLKELTERIVNLGIVQQMPTVQQYQFFQEVIDRIEIDNQKRVLGIYLKGWKTNIL
ncbi:recombinase family protein [Trichococcus sp.]|uniref:recombinase family protein n=1 Tax=Trichococcus sp. TaxID=1985464 RepID=UPI003C7CD5D8